MLTTREIINGQGHANAFGIVDLPIDQLDEAIEKLNEELRDVVYDATYRVDFILDINNVNIPLIVELSQFEDIRCQGIEDPMLAIENISLTRDSFEIFGKNEDTISFSIDGIKYVQFKCKAGNKLYDFLQDAWNDDDKVIFNIVGTPSINDITVLELHRLLSRMLPLSRQAVQIMKRIGN